jgi:protein-S-isoprenylcysteine O-methyltransferase Ste14
VAFKDQHAPSIPAKVLLAASILAGTLVSAALTSGYLDGMADLLKIEPIEANSFRQILLFSCCMLYFARFTVDMFVFVQRKIGWFEGGLVSFLFFMLFYLYGVSAGRHPEPVGLIEIIGLFLFLSGSYINTTAGYQRFAWKSKSENRGRLFTRGLFRYSMHINYFGDSVTYIGLALITREPVCLYVSFGIVVNFIVIQIPILDRHLSQKYGAEFADYAKQTRKFVPFVY